MTIDYECTVHMFIALLYIFLWLHLMLYSIEHKHILSVKLILLANTEIAKYDVEQFFYVYSACDFP